MRKLLIAVSIAGLGLTVVPSLLVFSGAIQWDLHAHLMLAGMLCWFASAPFWMKKSR